MTKSLLLFSALSIAAASAGDALRITGPFTHDNLSIFLLHDKKPVAGKRYLTLQEAMLQRKVVVHETGSVNQLEVENLSDDEIFIQSGDIVKGGKQDRVLKDDLILESKSGRVPLAAFCVEHGRWTKRGAESQAAFAGSNDAVAAKSMKMAVRATSNQQEVWNEVAKNQARLSEAIGVAAPASASPSSYQLTLENKAVKEISSGYQRSLEKIVDGKPDVVGFAFAINGKINSAEIYASNDLFKRLWPKLLKAAAVEATSERSKPVQAAAKTAEVKGFVEKSEAAPGNARNLSKRQQVITRDSATGFAYESRDKDVVVHRSLVAK
jgi:hypothetical protein